MSQSPPLVCLGFTEEKFPAGTHICHIYSKDAERSNSLFEFLRCGLEAGERTACFSEKVDEAALSKFLGSHKISLKDSKARGDLSLADANGVYFKDNRFDLERMLELLRQFEVASREAGCPACRVIGEMTPEIKNIEGGSRLLEYECRVSLLLKEHPVTAVCQYNAAEFDGATIMDILKVHPLMVVRGSVLKNPFFIPPEQFLSRQQN